MKYIKKLTKEQTEKLEEYIKSWLSLCTQKSDEIRCTQAIKNIYNDMGQDEPIVIWGDSPMECCLFYLMVQESELYSELRSKLHSELCSELRSKLYSELDSKLRSELDSQLRSKLYSELCSELDSKLRSKLRSELYSELDSKLHSEFDFQFRSKLYSELDSQLDSQLDSELRSELDSEFYSKLYSQLDSKLRSKLRSKFEDLKNVYYIPIWWRFWTCYYQFAYNELSVKLNAEKLRKMTDLANNTDCILPFSGVVFLSRKCKSWTLDDQGRLHNENDLAIKYADGWGIYSIHGVVVPDWLVLTPKEKLTIEDYKKLKSADQRIEFIAKVGIEKLTELGTVLDSYENYIGAEVSERFPIQESEYKLIDMSKVFEGMPAKFLQMKHLGNGSTVFEQVKNEDTTIIEALQSRLHSFNLDEYQIAWAH